MKFAQYWEKIELPVDSKIFGRKTVDIWGASNESSEEALIHAQSRATEFKKCFSKGFSDSHTYDYFNGFIKEELIEEITDSENNIIAVLTRNYYGAVILNSKSILFGDIDIPTNSNWLSNLMSLFGKPKKDKSYFIDKIKSFQKSHPQYDFKVYETLAGLRFVITNTLFDNQQVISQIFKALNVDPLYAKLCKTQSCFRARLTPKPWRVGLIYPDPASRFPRNNSNQEIFSSWLREYDYKSRSYSVVKEIAQFGNQPILADIKTILSIHDKYALTNNDELA